MRFTSLATSLIALLGLAACEQFPAPAASGDAGAQVASTAPAAAPAPTSPRGAYRIEKVTPLVSADADLGWFRTGEGSPREVGAFVGTAVIDGLEGAFQGRRDAQLEVDIRQFRPAIATQRGSDDAVHRVKVDFILRDVATGELLGRSNSLFMDLPALTGSAAVIATNAGRSAEVRVSERIARITRAWAEEASCADFACPTPVVVAAAPAPAPEPAPQPAAAPAPQPAPRPAAAPAPEPKPETEVAAAPAPAPVEAAPKQNLFEALTAALTGGDSPEESAPEAVAEAAPAPAPQPEPAAAPEPAPVETAEAAPADEGPSLFERLFAPQEEPAPAAEPAPETVVATAPEPAPAPAPESAAAPAPSPAPAPQETTIVATAPAAPAEPAQAVTPPTPQEEAGSPFFRSPASTVPTLPQQALLGRSQRANDPVRRRAGDIVLEVASLPAFWDGDQTTGGVWVALPYLPAYRRAIVTNPVNGRSVEANLFWRDPQAGGGSTLLSSDAASALGVAPGQTANLGVKIVNAD